MEKSNGEALPLPHPRQVPSCTFLTETGPQQLPPSTPAAARWPPGRPRAALSGKLTTGPRPSVGHPRHGPLTPASPWPSGGPPCPAKPKGLSPRRADPPATEEQRHCRSACCRRETRTCQRGVCQAPGVIHRKSSPLLFYSSSSSCSIMLPCVEAMTVIHCLFLGNDHRHTSESGQAINIQNLLVW